MRIGKVNYSIAKNQLWEMKLNELLKENDVNIIAAKLTAAVQIVLDSQFPVKVINLKKNSDF